MLLIAYADLKDLIEASFDLSSDALHVHVGLVLFFSGALLIRGERRLFYSLGALLALCLLGEMFDLSYDYSRGHELRWFNGFKDVVDTMLWPSILVVARPLVVRVFGYHARPTRRDSADRARWWPAD
jgi:1,4-dihydroxy-2-naphthoate octaprenyltransferase